MHLFHEATFLLVEDDDDHAYLMRRAFARHQAAERLTRVSDGEEALSYLKGEGCHAGRTLPDIVLLDINLPKKNGLEVLRELRGTPGLEQQTVIIVSTSATEEDRESAYKYGANSYLVKPVESGLFQDLMDLLIDYWGKWNLPPQSS